VTFAALLGQEAPVIRLRYENSSQSDPGKAGHYCPAEKAQVGNVADKAPSDVTGSRRTYMPPYMRRWRARLMAVEAPEAEKQPQVEGNPAPPIKERKPPSKGEREVRWAARAEEMKTLAENILRRAARDDGAAGSGLRAHIGARGMTARGYWMNETSGILRPTVEAYLGGGELSETGLMVLRQYLERSITASNSRGEGVEGLRERIADLDTREKLEAWLDDALDIGIDPL
jgi:hypothetical protein